MTNGKLVINNPQDIKDNGDYQCIAGNRYGTILSNSVQISFGCKYHLLGSICIHVYMYKLLTNVHPNTPYYRSLILFLKYEYMYVQV